MSIITRTVRLVVVALALAPLVGAGGTPEVKVIAGGKPVKYKLDLGFKLTCPHKLQASVADSEVASVSFTDGFTKNPTFSITGLQAGSTLVTFDVIAKDTFEMTSGNCMGSASQQAMITVVPDVASSAKDDAKSLKSIGKDYANTAKNLQKSMKSELNALNKQLKSGDITYEQAYSQAFLSAITTMEDAYVLGMNAIDLGAAGLSTTLSNLDADGYLDGTYMQGADGDWDGFFLGVTESWWGLAQRVNPDLQKGVERLNKTAGVSEDQQIEFNFVGTWATFSHAQGPIGDANHAALDMTRGRVTIVCALARALACALNGGTIGIGGWAEPDESITVDFIGPGIDEELTTTTDSETGMFGLTLQISFDGGSELPSGMYKLVARYSDATEGDVLFIQVP